MLSRRDAFGAVMGLIDPCSETFFHSEVVHVSYLADESNHALKCSLDPLRVGGNDDGDERNT